MNELTIGFTNYSEFKQSLDNELKANVEGFVRIGYLLKVARDTDILRESGHKNVAEFAAAEYGLTKDVVSRYIAINDRYSEGGYSDKLQVQFEGFGVSKLQEMLTLPDSIIEEITPTLTRQEILAIKKEVAAEEAITPIEVAIEAAAPEVRQEEIEMAFSVRVWKQYFASNPIEVEDDFRGLECPFFDAIVTNEEQIKIAKEKFFDVFGGRVVFARVPGTGKIMITVSEASEDKIVFTNIRSGEKQELKSMDALEDIKELVDAKGCTSEVFEELFVKKEEPEEAPKVEEPEKEEVAPVQPAEDFMPKPVQEDEQKVHEDVHEEEKHEAERSKETEGSRTDGNEDRKVPKAAADSADKTESKEVIRTERLGRLNVGDTIVNIDGTKGTMLGYCAGEYKIQTETGLILVNENSTLWKKEEYIEAEAKELKVNTDDNDREDRAAEEEKLKAAVEVIRDEIETISTICLELKCQDYSADDIAKSFEGIADIAEKIKQTAKDYLNSKGAKDGND